MDKIKRVFGIESGACCPEAVVQGEKYRFTVLTHRLLRMEYQEDGLFEDRPTQVILNRAFSCPEFTVQHHGTRLEIDTSAFRLVYYPHMGRFSPENLYIEIKNSYTNYGGRWRYGQTQYGDPQRHHNLYGTYRTLDKVDGAIDLPFGLMDTSGRSAWDDSASLILNADNTLSGRHPGAQDVYYFAYDHDYQGLLNDYFTLAGHPPMLPKWALGNWWSRYWKYTEESYNALMDRFSQWDIPFTVGVLDMDWHIVDVPRECGRGWTGWTWNREFFPDPDRFLNGLHNRGLHTSVCIHPADGIQPCEECYPAMAEAMGIEDGAPVPFEPENPAFWAAYNEHVLDPLRAQGVDFFWLDWQQGRYCGQPGADPLWIQNHKMFMDSCTDERRGMILSRYAGMGSHRYPLGFSGDTITTWASLAFQPYFTANATNVGYGWWSHDIGGFSRGVRDNELFVRWLQFGVFSPIMRLHCSSNPFMNKEPWAYDADIQPMIVRQMQLRHELMPYLYTLNARSHFDGMMPLRPLYYAYPDAPEAYCHPNEYFFGSELLVSAVSERTHFETHMACTDTFIPEGIWYDFFTGDAYEGPCELKLCRPLENQLVLARSGAIVPMADWRNPLENPAVLKLKVFAGKGGFTLYEDDGDGYGYAEDKRAQTRFDLTRSGSGWKLACAVSGDTSFIPADRQYEIEFVGFGDVRASANVPCTQDGNTATVSAVAFELLIETIKQDPFDVTAAIRGFLMLAQIEIVLKMDIFDAWEKYSEKPHLLAAAWQKLNMPDAVHARLLELIAIGAAHEKNRL